MRKLLFTFFIVFPTILLAQISIKDSTIGFHSVAFSMAYQTPNGAISKLFGDNLNFGVNYYYKTAKNWTFGVQGSYIFGEKIKYNGYFDNIITEKGAIVSQDGEEAEVRISERGFTGFVTVGHIFPVLSPNPNCGIYASIGAGFLRYYLRINVLEDNAPQLTDDYKKGYDRLTAGPAVSGFLGYVYHSNKRLVNFFAGVEFMQAWTKNLRGYNYDTQQYDTEQKIDQLLGIRAGWVFPLYKRTPNQYYYR